MKATRFGGRGKPIYTFPAYQQSFNTRSNSVNVPMVSMPGASGQYPGLGYKRQPVVSRTMSLSFTLYTRSNNMDALRDEVAQLQWWGNQKLFAETTSGKTRWINCFVQSVDMPENGNRHTDIFQPVTINFIADDPFFYEQGSEAWSWGDGTKWGEANWGGSATPVTCSGVQTDFEIEVGGNVPTLPRITIKIPTGESAQNVRVQRLVNATAYDQIRWSGTLNADDTLEVNCRAKSVDLNGSDAYSNSSWQQPTYLWWFQLEPGVNNIRVLQANASDESEVTVRSFDAYI